MRFLHRFRRDPGRLHPEELQLLKEIKKMAEETNATVTALAGAVSRVCTDVGGLATSIATALAAHPATAADDTGQLSGFVTSLNGAADTLEALAKEADAAAAPTPAPTPTPAGDGGATGGTGDTAQAAA